MEITVSIPAGFKEGDQFDPLEVLNRDAATLRHPDCRGGLVKISSDGNSRVYFHCSVCKEQDKAYYRTAIQGLRRMIILKEEVALPSDPCGTVDLRPV